MFSGHWSVNCKCCENKRYGVWQNRVNHENSGNAKLRNAALCTNKLPNLTFNRGSMRRKVPNCINDCTRACRMDSEQKNVFTTRNSYKNRGGNFVQRCYLPTKLTCAMFSDRWANFNSSSSIRFNSNSFSLQKINLMNNVQTDIIRLASKPP